MEKEFERCAEPGSPYKIRIDRNCKTSDPHWHTTFEIIIFEDGSGITYVNKVGYEFKRKYAMILSPVDAHYIVNDEGVRHDCTKINITGNFYSNNISDKCKFDSYPVATLVSDRDYERIEDILKQLKKEYDEKSAGSSLMAENLIEQVFIIIKRSCAEQENNSEDDSIKQALNYIQENFNKQIYVSDVAEHIHYSASHFSRIFTRKMKISFQDYIMDLRFNYAMNAIKFSDRPISKICYEVGFKSQAHFTRAFKAKYGHPPLYFRKKVNSNITKDTDL